MDVGAIVGKLWRPVVGAMIFSVYFSSSAGCDTANEEWLASTRSLRSAVLEPEEDVIDEFSFGILRTGQSATHVFQLSNKTDSPQTIREITTQCSCTIADVSSKVIRPGESVDVNIRLLTGDREWDLRKQVLIKFVEPEAAPRILTFVAHVRDPISVSPNRIFINSNTTSSRRDESNVTVCNYTDQKWKSLMFEPLDKWVECTAWEVPIQTTGVKPLQMWRVTVQCDTSPTPSTYKETSVIIRASEVDTMFTKLGIALAVKPRITTNKQHVHFGCVRSADARQEAVRFEFANTVAIPKPTDIKLNFSRKELFDFRWRAKGPTLLELVIRLRPTALHIGDVISDTVEISFPLSDQPPTVFSFPITARICD